MWAFEQHTEIFHDLFCKSFITLLLSKESLSLGRESVEVFVCRADFWVFLVFGNVSAERGDDRRQLLRGEHVVLVVACDRLGGG
jgi:hypothetical protein